VTEQSSIENSSMQQNGFQKSIRIGVVFGGRSSEHEVSLASAANVMDALTRAGYQVSPIGIAPSGRWLIGGDPMKLLSDNASSASVNADVQPEKNQSALDAGKAVENWALLPSTTHASQLAAIDVIFPVLHGPYGEDGTIQGLLEMANLPYVGCGVASSAVAMDKVIAKQLFAVAALPQVKYCVVLRNNYKADADATCANIEAALRYPLFVKPANLGSSVGVTKASNRQELLTAIAIAAQYDRKILVEEAVPNCREIEVSVLGNDDPIASVPGEVVPGHDFYDYAAKYLDDSSQLLIPAQLTAEQVSTVQEMAVRAFQAIDGTGLARVDFLMDDQNGNFYLNEINTMPGFTRISMYPKLWEASGISYPELVDRLVQLALAHYDDRQQNSTTR
jgi:D-alanine-D-alanine ligase